ncbi:hypothetical protein [Microbacterium sp.]|uniref:hypothetical protein n=1 Tax=Microbacterium sp. TaxID=51671 RepID=UPI003A949B3E
MTGVWEQRLQNIANGQRFAMPAAKQLVQTMDELTPLLDKAAADPGIAGKTGMAASDSLQDASRKSVSVSATTQQLTAAVTAANAVQDQAEKDLAGLSSGQLSPTDEAIVRAAATGATIMFPGFSVLAGEGAVQLVNWFLGNKREETAKAAVQRASEQLDAIYVPQSMADPSALDGTTPKNPGGSVPGSTGTGGGGGGPSFANYPDAGSTPTGSAQLPPGITVHPPSTDPGYTSPGYNPPGYNPGGYPTYPGPGDDGSLHPVVVPPGQDPWGPGGGLTPNGPGAGGTTWGPGAGVGGPVGSGGGSGSGLLGGVGAGIGGAAVGGVALVGGARMAGRGGLGAGGVGVGGAGIGGVGGVGMAGAGGANGAGARTAGRAGGLLGGGAAGRQGGAARGSSGSAAGGRGGLMGAGGSGRGASDRDRQEGRGLGGPIAPKLEDDEERGPRSEAAGAGGRD